MMDEEMSEADDIEESAAGDAPASGGVDENYAEKLERQVAKEKPLYSAQGVARYITDLHAAYGNKLLESQGVTILINMVYIAHGHCLAKLDKPLISDTIETSRFGPAIRSLYDKVTGLSEIPQIRYALRHKRREAKAIAKDEKVAEVIDTVVTNFKTLTPFRLTSVVRRPGSPWESSLRAANPLIPNMLIRAYYVKTLKLVDKIVPDKPRKDIFDDDDFDDYIDDDDDDDDGDEDESQG